VWLAAVGVRLSQSWEKKEKGGERGMALGIREKGERGSK